MALSLSFQPSSSTIIYANSPIVYKFEGANPLYTYIISLSATTGLQSTLAEYVTINISPDLDNYIIVNVNNIVKNYIRSNFNKNTENAAYIKVSCIEYNGLTVNATVVSNLSIAVYGNTKYMDGLNYSNSAKAYILSSTPKIIELPSYGGTGNTYSIPFCNNNTCTYHINYYSLTSGATYTPTQSFPSVTDAKSNIFSIACGYSDINYDVDATKDMELVVNDSTMAIIHSIKIKPIQCNGNQLHVLKFINRHGSWDRIFIKGKIEESQKSTSETYKYNKINRTTMTYTTDGSYHKLFSNSKTQFKLNTGWISESMNILLGELNDSDYVYYDNMPCIVKDTDITYKTHKYDKLINYMITIELAFDNKNNII